MKQKVILLIVLTLLLILLVMYCIYREMLTYEVAITTDSSITVAEESMSGDEGTKEYYAEFDNVITTDGEVIIETILPDGIDYTETRPMETKPIETGPIETGPIETGPIETGPTETEPCESDPEELESDGSEDWGGGLMMG